MTQAKERSDLGTRAGAVAEEMFTLKEEEEVYAANKRLNAMRARRKDRQAEEASEEEEEAAKGAGHKKESAAPRDKWGGKLRMIMHAHDSTDQVSDNTTQYRRAPTRKTEHHQSNATALTQYSEHGERGCKKENVEEERRRVSLEGAAAIRASSAAELRFRLEAGKA